MRYLTSIANIHDEKIDEEMRFSKVKQFLKELPGIYIGSLIQQPH